MPRQRLLKFSTSVCVLASLSAGLGAAPSYARQSPPVGAAQNVPKPTPEVQALLDKSAAARDARKYDEAVPLAQQAIQLAQLSKDKEGEAAVRLSLGKTYVAANQAQKGLDEYAAALTLFRSAGDRPGEAQATAGCGTAWYYLGQPLKAKTFFEQALPLYHALNKRIEEAGMMMNIAIISDNTGDPKAALQAYAKVLPLFRELKNLTGEANTLANIAVSYGKIGDSPNALAYHMQALAIYRSLKNAAREELTLDNISRIYNDLGHFDKALDYAQQALRLAQSLGDKQAIAGAQIGIGDAYQNMGQIAQALDYLQRGLQTALEVNDKRDQCTALTDSAIIESRSGNPRKALESFQKALALNRELSDRNSEASTLLNIGFVYTDVEQPEMARGYFEQARTLSRGLTARTVEAQALGGLATVSHQTGKIAQALAYDRQALSLLRAQGQTDNVANVLGNVAAIEVETHQWSQAQGHFEEALTLFRSQKDNYGVATALSGLGQTEEGQGRWQAAARNYRQALSAAESVESKQYQATSLYNLARMERKQRQSADAETHLRQAIHLIEAVRGNFGGLYESQAGYFSGQLPVYYALLTVLLDQGKAGEAFAIAQKTKARSLLDFLASGRVNMSLELTPDERAQETALRQRADALNTQMVKEGVSNKVGAKKRFALLRGQLRGVENELRALSEALYTRHPGLADKQIATTATLASLSAQLPSDTALLDYILLSDKKLLLFVITTRQGKARVNVSAIPVTSARLQQECAAFRAACADPRRDYQPLAARLSRLLLSPASAQLAGKRRLVLCPDGPLWNAPFQALTLPAVGKRVAPFLWQRYDLAYAYSATGMQAALRAHTRQMSKPTGTMLVVANPAFGGSKRFGDLNDLPGQRPLSDPSRPLSDPSRPLSDPSRPLSAPSRPLSDPSRPLSEPSRSSASPSRAMTTALEARGGEIAALPGTQREADALRLLFPDAVCLTGAAAQENTAKARMSRFRYLHFATHGFFNDAAPLLSCIVLARPDKNDPAASREDGFLTAREVFDLHLSADLATLSACNTGRGAIRTGEGMVGLSWAFFVAGVPTQVVSQWSVDDAATAQLMRAFYTGLKAGADKSQALRQAALSLQREKTHQHPYVWAPFLLMGDWRR